MHYCFLSEMSKTVIILSRLETIGRRILLQRYFSITTVQIDISTHNLHQNKGKCLGHLFILIKYIISYHNIIHMW